jgi:pyridoxamine 5'-phosphate oxidase
VDVSEIRREYMQAGLDERDLPAEPMAPFRAWFEEALAAETRDPTAMTLATADRQGRPAARMVLLKGFDEHGFVFYTNYGSRKAREIEANPYAALVFYWPVFDRQVRVEGRVARVDAAESAAYFASRPVASQLGAWASRQSEPIGGRAELERNFAAAAERFADAVPVPAFWGGYRLRHDLVELWQGRPSRLHDRLVYRRGKDDGWTRERLQP